MAEVIRRIERHQFVVERKVRDTWKPWDIALSNFEAWRRKDDLTYSSDIVHRVVHIVTTEVHEITERGEVVERHD